MTGSLRSVCYSIWLYTAQVNEQFRSNHHAHAHADDVGIESSTGFAELEVFSGAVKRRNDHEQDTYTGYFTPGNLHHLYNSVASPELSPWLPSTTSVRPRSPPVSSYFPHYSSPSPTLTAMSQRVHDLISHMLGWFKQLNDTYGPVSTFTLPPWGRGILINRPEWLLYVKQADMQKYSRGPVARALFTEFPGAKTPVASEGAGWRLARKSMYPIFTVKSFTEHVSSAMDTIVPTARTFLLNASKKNITVDWNDLAGRIALSIFSHSAFTLDTGALTTDPSIQGSDDMRDALLSLNLISARRLFNPFWHWIEYVTGDRFRFNRARSYIRNVVLQMVEARRAEIRDIPTGERPNDFLTALLEDPAFDDPVQIRDTLVTLLFAGRDNTQNVLAWGLHALMSAPEWIERLRAEATNNAAEDHELRYSDLSRYPVHLAVFYETVRLWPGLPKNARLALCDDVLPALPEHGIPAVKIEKGDYVFWSDYNIMRDEAVWGVNSNTFDPSRHLASDGSFIRPAQPKFNGFGAGPRLCPAAQLATYEFVATMAGILPFFDFEPSKAPGLYEEPSMNESFTSSLAGPLWVDVRVRKGMD